MKSRGEEIGRMGEALGRDAMDLAVARRLDEPERLEQIFQQLAAGANCPPSSSLGRLFDAVAGLCGLARANRYEGQAPMLLEAAAAEGVRETYPYRLSGDEPFVIDHAPLIRAVVADLQAGTDVPTVAARFHNTVAAFLAASAGRARELTGLNTVALSGGCFANRYLSARLEGLLREADFAVLTHHGIPCNDGGLALGQAVVAARCTTVAPEAGRRARNQEPCPPRERTN